MLSKHEILNMTKTLSIIGISILALLAIAYFLFISVGKPISTDLTLIGKGKPALVLIYENFSPTAGDSLNRLRKIKRDYESRLVFVVADIGTPQGAEFAKRFQLINNQAIFLNGQGKPQGLKEIPLDEDQLRKNLDARLASLTD